MLANVRLAVNDPAAIRAASRQRYGHPLSEVEAGWQALAEEPKAPGGLGRRPRRASVKSRVVVCGPLRDPARGQALMA